MKKMMSWILLAALVPAAFGGEMERMKEEASGVVNVHVDVQVRKDIPGIQPAKGNILSDILHYIKGLGTHIKWFGTSYANHVGQAVLRDAQGGKFVLHFFGGNHNPGFPWGGDSFNDFVGLLCPESGENCRPFERSVFPSSGKGDDHVIHSPQPPALQGKLSFSVPGLALEASVQGNDWEWTAYTPANVFNVFGDQSAVMRVLAQHGGGMVLKPQTWRQQDGSRGTATVTSPNNEPYAGTYSVEQIFVARELGEEVGVQLPLGPMDMHYDYVAGMTYGKCRPIYLMEFTGGVRGVDLSWLLGIQGSFYYDFARNERIETNNLGISYETAGRNVLYDRTYEMEHPFHRRLVRQQLTKDCAFYGMEERHIFSLTHQ